MGLPTCEKNFENGRPLSLAKAHVRRDPDASIPKVVKNEISTIAVIINVADRTEPVAW